MTNLNRNLLSLLANGEFHSGSQLADALALSRTAINNHIKQLQEMGVDIYSVKGKGYRLAAPMDLLDKDLIGPIPRGTLFVLEDVDSTNEYLLSKIGTLATGDCCLAEYQTQGRGRRGRQWVSPYGSAIYLSMYWQLGSGIAQTAGMSLAVGVALAEALDNLGHQQVSLKWPNDLLIGGRKLGGILIEMRGQFGEAADMVIGVGINVQLPEQQNIDQPWINLNSQGGVVNRNALASELIKVLQAALSQFEHQGLTPFLSRWDRFDRYRGKEVALTMGDKQVVGVCEGIDETGALKLKTDVGIELYNGGEVSLRPA
ncbi:bifunctional biotin--[acetyl-CoA-carboxylase] ligase/biotin operon repressor BirA [Ferrimonas aestuarii]|uniref:Bifunctional ligase/repressor BirA n=1 Tax=Ferrimonas aestuarii TaxID=2569539 RepID=A0A4U1BEJ0_9GAMM|nr:bifunctional biotin--[acetyl-CoA-carboxylase] ligase/biotin operon repressor BirA [Ferrimonas aestuarii]TKB49575.1 bifunctional biotin--[acetyl-CoA-carboxylase] ligase/biotin operon repressor BirA [Ferrimonas aestuarii]